MELNTIRQSEIIEFQGYLAIATCFHYFKPRSLKIVTELHIVGFDDLINLINKIEYDSTFLEGSRRWLQAGEAPYPGYCRAPGSTFCSPLLCNCEKLTEIWNKIRDNEIKVRQMSGT